MKDYIIVESGKSILLRFNNLILEIFKYLNKKEYHIAQENLDQLTKLYEKLIIKENKKHALAILLNEINSQIEFGMLKQDINKEIKIHNLSNITKQKIIIILDGASGDKALELANTPNLNFIAKNGKCGIMYPIKGVAPESGAAQFSILGYPLNKYPGRGPIEALGINYKIKNETALRCNFASFKGSKIINYRIPIPSKDLIKKLNKIDKDIKIIPTIGYRAVMIVKNISQNIKNTHPGYIKYKTFSKAIQPKLIKIKTNNKKINNFIEKAEKILKNKTILIRGAGNKLPKLKKLKDWILMADAPIEIGLGRLLGMEIKEKKDIINKIINSKKNIYIQIKGPDTYAHKKDLKGKIKAIEDIDKLLKPLTKIKDKIICITCDHSTPYSLGIHSKDPVPVLIYGKGSDKAKRFTTKECKKGSLKTFNSKDLMKKL